MRRVPEFDALRALAVGGVLLYHLQGAPGTWFHFGFTGVHLFLVLSGYLITGIILRHLDAPHFLRAFYARRVLRIWPIYYLTLAVLIVQQRYFYPNPPSLSGLPYFLTFTQYLWAAPGLSGVLPQPKGIPVHAFDHSWTLALEEQFYLLWPLAIVLFGRRMIVPMIAATVGVGIWFKTLHGPENYFSWLLPYVAGSFAMGGFIAVLLRDPALVQRCRGLLSLGFLASGLAGFAYVYAYYKVYPGTLPASWPVAYAPYWHSLQNYGFYTIWFGIVGFVATNAGAWFLAPLRLKELTFLGEISYGLYLYHLPIYWLMNNSGTHDATNDPWTVWLSKVTLTFVVATLSYRYIEMPILRLKRFFPYEEETTAEAKAQAAAATAVHQPRMVYGRPASLVTKTGSTDKVAATSSKAGSTGSTSPSSKPASASKASSGGKKR